MKLSTFNKYYHRATPLFLSVAATQSTPAEWVEEDNIDCNTIALDRLGFIEMYADTYFNPEKYRFYNVRNHQGILLYPYTDEDKGQILGVFNVSARFDAWGNVNYYLYTLRRVDG